MPLVAISLVKRYISGTFEHERFNKYARYNSISCSHCSFDKKSWGGLSGEGRSIIISSWFWSSSVVVLIDFVSDLSFSWVFFGFSINSSVIDFLEEFSRILTFYKYNDKI